MDCVDLRLPKLKTVIQAVDCGKCLLVINWFERVLTMCVIVRKTMDCCNTHTKIAPTKWNTSTD